MKKLTANILFSGIGCQERGVENSNAYDLEVLSTSDVNKEAILGYAAIHCGLTPELIDSYPDYPPREVMAEELIQKHIGYDPDHDKEFDWMKLATKKNNELEKYWLAVKLSKNRGDISRIDRLPYADFWTVSFPCFTGDTLVLTSNGYKQIKDIIPGEYVLTHDNTYKKVLRSEMTGTKPIYEVCGTGIDNIKCTENHKFYVRQMTRHYPTYEDGRRGNIRTFDEPHYVECKDLDKNTYLGVAINQNSIIPTWNGIDYKNGKHVNELQPLMDNEDFWWIMGRYIGDGWCRSQGGIIICSGKHKCIELEHRLFKCGLHYNKVEERTTYKYHIAKIEFEAFVKQFGYKANGKFIPGFVFDLPENLLKAFIEGYHSADGTRYDEWYKITSINKTLIYGVAQCIAKVYKRPYRIGCYKRPHTCMIEGRKVKQHDTYDILWRETSANHDQSFYENGYVWFPVREVKALGITEDVYDIEVEDNHSFTANGVIVHNCQSISIAGKMKGLNPDSGTRSSLIWENIRLLKIARDETVLDSDGNPSPYGNLPKFVMLENVKNLVSKKFINDFLTLVDVFKTEFHMNCYWKVLNAKECGVPQNRERVFAIFVREDIDSGKFEFPMPFDAGIRLKDILADTVDEKYYININKAYELVTRLYDKGELNHDSEMQPNSSEIEPYILTDCGGDFAHKADNACTLMARDWKGMNNYGSNGVVEKHVAENVPKRLGNIYGEKYTGGNFAGNVYDKENCSPTIMTAQGGNRQPMVLLEEESALKNSEHMTLLNKASGAEDTVFKVKQATAKGYAECVDGGVVDLSYPSSKTRRGRCQDNGTVSPTICANGTELCRIETANPKITIGNVSYRIRRLTPEECIVLMGLTAEDAQKMKDVGLSNTHIYKCAGNGIVTNCVALIMQHLYKAQEDEDFFCDDELFN